MARPKSNGTAPTTATIGFEAKLWLTADTATRGRASAKRGAKLRSATERRDNLRNNMDAAEYSRAERDRLPTAARRVGAEAPINHVVLGLIFLKYISDTFEEHRAKLLAGSAAKTGDYAGANAEDPDEYKAENVFWVPADARWSHLQASAKQPTIGKTVDDAMVAIERDNPRLKGVLPKDYARPGLDNQRLGELIDVIATIELTAASEGEKTHRSVDLLGRVYDWSGATKTAAGSPQGERGGAHQYFLTRFASAEGKNGGPAKCEVRSANVEVKTTRSFAIRNSSFHISPDPACGSGGMFVQSEKFVESHGGVAKCEVRSASVEVKTSRPFVIRNSSFDISSGPEHADTFRRDLGMANAEVRMWN